MANNKIDVGELTLYELKLYTKEFFERHSVWGICPNCMESVIMEGEACNKCGFDPVKALDLVSKDVAVYIHRKGCPYLCGSGICSSNDEKCDGDCTYMKFFKNLIDDENRG